MTTDKNSTIILSLSAKFVLVFVFMAAPARACFTIVVGKDADIVLLDKDLEIDTVIAKGQIMVKDKQAVVKGTFED